MRFLIITALHVALFSAEVVWEDNSAFKLSDEEYKKVIRDYVHKTNHKEAKVWDKKQAKLKVLQKQQELISYNQKRGIVVVNALMWQDNKEAQTIEINWNGAKKYCQNLTLAGFNDWYLPSIDELQSIVLDGTCGIKKGFKKLNGCSFFSAGGLYWSSNNNGASHAMGLHFGNGGDRSYFKSSNRYVRCVRSQK